MGTISAMDAAWKTLKVGAGGYLTGIDIAADGTMVVRTDTYGAYVWNGTGWNQLVTTGSMASNGYYGGTYEIRIAASSTNIFYMANTDGIYRSTDQGQNWTKTNLPATVFNGNSSERHDGQRMAIDPANSNFVIAGTQSNGLWMTRDGGTTWSKVTAVPQGTAGDGGYSGIYIKGSTIYVGTAGNGVYSSTDGGTTWKAIGGPANASIATMSADGSYFASENGSGALWKYSGGVWSTLR